MPAGRQRLGVVSNRAGLDQPPGLVAVAAAGLHVAAVTSQHGPVRLITRQAHVISLDVAGMIGRTAAARDRGHGQEYDLARPVKKGVVGVGSVYERRRGPIAGTGRGIVENTKKVLHARAAEEFLRDDDVRRQRAALELAVDGGLKGIDASARIVGDVPFRHAQLSERSRGQQTGQRLSGEAALSGSESASHCGSKGCIVGPGLNRAGLA